MFTELRILLATSPYLITITAIGSISINFSMVLENDLLICKFFRSENEKLFIPEILGFYIRMLSDD
jgi:hypothetical protein